MKNCYIKQLSPHQIAIADLVDYYDSGLIITRINVPREFRGQGHASDLLNQICADADAEGIRLWLEIQPGDGENGLDYESLRLWYERHGFKNWRRTGIYLRRPRTAITGFGLLGRWE